MCLLTESMGKKLLAKRMTYTQSLDVSVLKCNESTIGPGGIIAVAWITSYAVIYVLNRSI